MHTSLLFFQFVYDFLNDRSTQFSRHVLSNLNTVGSESLQVMNLIEIRLELFDNSFMWFIFTNYFLIAHTKMAPFSTRRELEPIIVNLVSI